MKYIMVWPYGWFDQYMYRDVIDNQMVEPFCLNHPHHSKLLNLLKRIHHSYKLNQIVELPFKEVWDKDLFRHIDNDTCVMFDTGALSMVSTKFLTRIRKTNKHVKMVVVAMDSVHGASAHIRKAIPNLLGFQWDAILSYDKDDCQEYGFQFLGQGVYSKLDNVFPDEQKSDVYYVGRDKAGRNQEVISLYKKFKEAGIVTDFHLVSLKKEKNLSEHEGIKFSRKDIPYENVVSAVLSTNCILEVASKGQFAQTARYYEAICYNKKLLTNNFAVKDLPFYNERYIKCFKTADDIDMEWVKRREPIDYHYNGEFSPVHVLEKLDRAFKSPNHN